MALVGGIVAGVDEPRPLVSGFLTHEPLIIIVLVLMLLLNDSIKWIV